MKRFAPRLLDWHRQHGRTGLPWQEGKDPYHIWLSEIMLQQTQVATVIPYYQRFLERFPDVASLAAADEDAVLHLWSGLGYYARARNLHRAAQMIVTAFNGDFPDNLDDVMSLPGIGKSTAGAILAFAFQQRHPILDGNVKRVLTRCHAIEGYPGDSVISGELWKLADKLTPSKDVARYTQAIMDLGATVCTRTKPACPACPFHDDCTARQQGNPTAYPARRQRKSRPLRHVDMLVLEDGQGRVLLQKRPSTGIWGGLWSLPESEPGAETPPCPLPGGTMAPLDTADPPPIRHGFTHFELEIRPRRYHLLHHEPGTMDGTGLLWYNLAEPSDVGLPAAIQRLLSSIN